MFWLYLISEICNYLLQSCFDLLKSSFDFLILVFSASQTSFDLLKSSFCFLILVFSASQTSFCFLKSSFCFFILVFSVSQISFYLLQSSFCFLKMAFDFLISVDSASSFRFGDVYDGLRLRNSWLQTKTWRCLRRATPTQSAVTNKDLVNSIARS